MHTKGFETERSIPSRSFLPIGRAVPIMERSQTGGGRTSRRRLLRRTGATVAGSVLLAGCTEDVGEELPPNEHWTVANLLPDLPVHERMRVLVAGIEDLSDESITDVETFVTALEERGLELESVEVVVEQLHLEYVEPDPERRGMLEVTGMIAGAYAALVAGGFEGRGLEVVVFETDGSTIGIVEIATEWAVEFVEGGLTAEEYGELVAATIESRRTPPEPDVAPDE